MHDKRLIRALKSVSVQDRPALEQRLHWYKFFDYDPPFAHYLNDEEITLVAEWFADTTDQPYIGDTGFITISFISNLIYTNGIKSVVQLGHYAGFSSLIIGMILRKIHKNSRLISFDIDHRMTDYSHSWMEKAGLQALVKHICMDSTDPLTLKFAGDFLNSRPELIFIDASKQYHNTLKEIELWHNYISGFLVAHDVSLVAKSDQANGAKGVDDALRTTPFLNANDLIIVDPATERGPGYPFLDPCGIGLAVLRGELNLPKADNIYSNLYDRREILEPHKLNEAANWFLEEAFEFKPGVLRKLVGRSGWATCYAPINPGQRLACEVRVSGSNGKPFFIYAGGNPGSGYELSGDGHHVGEFIAGDENSLVGIYGSEDAKFSIESLRIVSKS